MGAVPERWPCWQADTELILLSAVHRSAMTAADSKAYLSHAKLERIFNYLRFKRVDRKLTSKILQFFDFRYTSSISLEEVNNNNQA